MKEPKENTINNLLEGNEIRCIWYNEKEESEVTTNCSQLKMTALDGKSRQTDTLDTEGIFRLIE